MKDTMPQDICFISKILENSKIHMIYIETSLSCYFQIFLECPMRFRIHYSCIKKSLTIGLNNSLSPNKKKRLFSFCFEKQNNSKYLRIMRDNKIKHSKKFILISYSEYQQFTRKQKNQGSISLYRYFDGYLRMEEVDTDQHNNKR